MKKNSINFITNLKKTINKNKKDISLLIDTKVINKFKAKIDVLNLKIIKNKVNPTSIIKQISPVSWIESLQDKLEKFVTTEANPEVLVKQSTYWASAITWLLMGSTAFAIGWVSIAKTDEIVIAMGKLEPKSGVIDIQMPIEGVASEILVKDGDRIEKGQILIRLDTEASQANYNALRKSLEFNKLIVDKYDFLVKEGAISEIQYLQQKEKIENIKSQIKASLVQLKYQEIVSPVNGVVFELQPKEAGFVARTSQPILKIVPLDNLVAKVEIDSRTIGFVQAGKPVEISIDSYPASDFGVVEGELISIGSDALEPSPAEGKGYRFPATIALNNQYLQLKSGRKLSLQAGMSLSANIKLRKVTYLQLLLNKFSDKADSLKAI